MGETPDFNNAPGVDIWCGKAYRESNSSFDPGGRFEEPAVSSFPLLNFRVRPRMSIYLDNESNGSLLIDAGISYQVGQPLTSRNYSDPALNPTLLKVDVIYDGGIVKTTSVFVGTTNNEVALDLECFPGSLGAYNISIEATLGRDAVYTASAELFRLPYPEHYGSISRVDNLYGGLWVQRGDEAWSHIFPYTYYVQWTLYWNSNITTLDDFAALGYNVIHIVPTGSLGDKPFPWDEFEPYLQRADELGLYFQYDVIWQPQNSTEMVEQVEHLRSHPSMLLWYQSDEPDGKSNPLNSTGLAYEKIRELDPYHPISLALNCHDFYYSNYAAGGDIVLTDTYPIAINATFSTVYNTECNLTYGCCGCDNCDGVFEDISTRIDEFHRRDGILGWSKTQWYAPQAFGNETFWARYPTAAEEAVMTFLAINHGAKGIVMWNYPTTPELLEATNRMAVVLTSATAGGFFLEAPLFQGLEVQGGSRIDAAIWVNKENKKALLSVVNLNYKDLSDEIRVVLPDGVLVESIDNTLWGDSTWDVDGAIVTGTDGLGGLQVSLLVLSTEP
ncbi:hypothetical protein B0O99DRAFT_656262 [Bisporella sp. PMI_857]|nr:hypothetical protein B0O99DRAFT_656262 [Bisporella sp. PMI_857]